MKNCTFYTDNWDAFSNVLPKDRHVIGKKYTTAIEQDNSDTRHHLARMTRRTKVVSKTVEMLNITIKLWAALRNPDMLENFMVKIRTIFN